MSVVDRDMTISELAETMQALLDAIGADWELVAETRPENRACDCGVEKRGFELWGGEEA